MKRILVVLFVAVFILTTGCQAAVPANNNQQTTDISTQQTSAVETQAEQTEKQAEQPADEAVMYLGDLSEPAMGFDPVLGWANVDGVSIFHSNLLRQDSQMNIVGDLAKSFHISDDGKIYTFKLNDAKFSDGTKITSQDVAFTYQKATEIGYVGNLDQITSIETPDEQTVIMHLAAPNSLFVYTVIRLGIVPQDSYTEDYGKNPISSGPYQLLQWDKGQQLIVEENPHYFGQKPKIKKLTILFLSEEAAFETAKQGKLDVYSVPSVYTGQAVDGMDLVHFKSVDVLNIGLSFQAAGAIQREDGLAVGNDITADKAIRKALNIGIDRKMLVDGILGGYGSPAYDLVDPAMPWYNPATTYQGNDVAGAKALLAAAGWHDGDGDGVVEKDGIKAEMTLVAASSSKTYQGLAMAVAEMAKQFGIQINVESKTWEEIDTMIYSTPYVLAWGSKDPINIYYIFKGANSGKGYYNSGYYLNETVDHHIDQALQATSQDEAYQYWQQAQWDGQTGFSTKGDAPWLWLVRSDHVYRIKQGLNIGEQGLQNPSMGWALLHNITEWTWLE